MLTYHTKLWRLIVPFIVKFGKSFNLWCITILLLLISIVITRIICISFYEDFVPQTNRRGLAHINGFVFLYIQVVMYYYLMQKTRSLKRDYTVRSASSGRPRDN